LADVDGFLFNGDEKALMLMVLKMKKEYFGHLRPIFPALQSGTRLIGWLQGDYAINYGLFYGFLARQK
jgi:hypothetical protein